MISRNPLRVVLYADPAALVEATGPNSLLSVSVYLGELRDDRPVHLALRRAGDLQVKLADFARLAEQISFCDVYDSTTKRPEDSAPRPGPWWKLWEP